MDLIESLAIDDFAPGLNSGAVDCTPYLAMALADVATATGRSRSIRFNGGVYQFATKPPRIGTGVVLRGAGSAGSTPGYGTHLQCAYPIADPLEGFLEWTGGYLPGFAGTGGGLRDLTIGHTPGTSGGCPVKLSGADDSHRAGDFLVFNIGLGVTGNLGTFHKGLVVDGTHLTTPGGAGVRTIYLQNVNISSCSDPDSNLWFYNAVHVHAVNVHCYPGPGLCGVTLDGPVGSPSQNVFFSSSNIDGNLVCNRVLEVNWHGRVGGGLTVLAPCDAIRIYGSVYGTRTLAPGPHVIVYD